MKIHPEKVVLDIEAEEGRIIRDVPSLYASPHLSFSVKCTYCVSMNKGWIAIGCILLLTGIIATVIAITQKTTIANPCTSYTSSDLAVDISLSCFRYMWANNGCKDSVPDGFTGWWLRSPQGGRTIPCSHGMAEDQCGAGSYGYVQNNVYRCILWFKGI